MDGLWTVRPHPQSWPAWNLADGPRPIGPVPVVPCDVAAIERGAAEVATLPDYVFDQAAGGDRDACREIAESVLRGAGETP